MNTPDKNGIPSGANARKNVADEALRAQLGFQTAGLGEFDAAATFDHMSGKWTVVYSAFGWHWHDGYLSQKAGEYHV